MNSNILTNEFAIPGETRRPEKTYVLAQRFAEDAAKGSIGKVALPQVLGRDADASSHFGNMEGAININR
jgi:hypothetical protein